MHEGCTLHKAIAASASSAVKPSRSVGFTRAKTSRDNYGVFATAIKRFYSTSENAIKTQICIAVSV